MPERMINGMVIEEIIEKAGNLKALIEEKDLGGEVKVFPASMQQHRGDMGQLIPFIARDEDEPDRVVVVIDFEIDTVKGVRTCHTMTYSNIAMFEETPAMALANAAERRFTEAVDNIKERLGGVDG